MVKLEGGRMSHVMIKIQLTKKNCNVNDLNICVFVIANVYPTICRFIVILLNGNIFALMG